MRNWRSVGILLLSVVAIATLAAEAVAAGRGGRGRPVHRGFYGSPVWTSWGFFGPWGLYSPWWWGAPYVVPTGQRVGLRLEVQPVETEVYVDGYYAGQIDEFDGFFQRLNVSPGQHVIELFLDGYQMAREELYANPGTSYKIRHEMLPLAAGEAPLPRPRPRADGLEAPDASVLPQEPSRPAASPSASGFGVLVIRASPEPSEIRIDGEVWPMTPNGELAVHLPAGRHVVELRRAGYAPFSTEIDVAPGTTAPLNVKLLPSP